MNESQIDNESDSDASKEGAEPSVSTTDGARAFLLKLDKLETLVTSGQGGPQITGPDGGSRILTGLEGLLAVGLTRLSVLTETAVEIVDRLDDMAVDIKHGAFRQRWVSGAVEDEPAPAGDVPPFHSVETLVLCRDEAMPVAMAVTPFCADEIVEALNGLMAKRGVR